MVLVGRETESGGGPTDLFALARQPDGGGRRGGGDRGSAVTGAGVFEAAAACRRRAGGDDHGRVRAAAVARILRGAWCVRAPGGTDLADRHDHRASPMGCRRNRTHRRREGSINNQNRRPCRDLGRQRRFPVDAPASSTAPRWRRCRSHSRCGSAWPPWRRPCSPRPTPSSTASATPDGNAISTTWSATATGTPPATHDGLTQIAPPMRADGGRP